MRGISQRGRGAGEGTTLNLPMAPGLEPDRYVDAFLEGIDEALEAFQLCSRLEGIIPALEPAHALAHVGRIAGDLPSDHLICMNMCGRGDKDIFTVAEALGQEI